MASSLDEAVNGFINDVFANETLLQSERQELIRSAMLSLESKIDNGTHRWGVSMRLSDLGKEARRLRKKNREAVGFFGNWAKHHEEQDQDVGC